MECTENAHVAYLVPFNRGFKAICKTCQSSSTLYSHLETKLYVVNLAQYQQHCFKCGESVNPCANSTWPELFDGRAA